MSLRREELNVRFLFDYVRDGLIVADASSGRILFWNSAAEEIFGHTAAEIAGRPIEILMPESSRQTHGECLRRYIATGHGRIIDSHQPVELPALRKDGTALTIEISLGSISEPTSTQALVIASVRDVTHRKELEARASQADRLEAIGLLAGGVAHDFNNALQAIIGFSELALARLDPDDRNLTPLLVEISKAGERAAALTRQLLAFGQRQRLVNAPLDANLLITSLDQQIRDRAGPRIQLVLDLDPTVGLILADASQLTHVILTLSENAIEAMPDGGELRIATTNVLFSERSAEPMPPGAYVSIVVRDTGRGMDPETLSHIFEPFFTTTVRGRSRGLALASVYGIVKQSRGFIWADSVPERGTTFSLFFPQSDARRRIEIPEPMHAAPGAKTILVVDDEATVASLAGTVLANQGYAVLVAVHGESALQLAAEHKGQIDLLLTDVMMPGMTGPELAERLRDERQNLKVLYMSGYSARMLESAEDLAVAQVLQKPFSPKELVERVSQLLGAASSDP